MCTITRRESKRKISEFQGFKVKLEAEVTDSDLGFLFPSIHSLVRQAVGGFVLLAHRVADFEVLQTPHELLRFVVQLAQIGIADLVDPFHLANHELGIADHFKRFDVVFGGVAEGGQKALILGIVVSAMAEIFAEFGDGMAGGILDGDAVTGGAGIAASSAIDVGGVGGGSGFRRGEKVAGMRRRRGHGMSLQRG